MIRAKDIMTTELIMAKKEMTMEEVIRILVNNRITGLPVINEDNSLIGVVSEYDVIKTVDLGKHAETINLNKKIKYSSNVTSIQEDAPLEDILQLFIDKKVRRLPVLSKKNQLVGIITRRDIMRVLFYRSKKS